MTNLVQRKNGLETASKAFPNLNKVTPENKKKITNIPSNAPPISPNVHSVEGNSIDVSSNANAAGRKR